MPELIEIQSKHDFVLAVYAGEFSVRAAQRTVDRIVESCSDGNQRAVLLDCRQMTGKLSILDRFQTAVYGQKMIGKVSKLALVSPQKNVHPDRFVETVATNRGINLRIFIDMDEAVEWLKS